MKKLNKIFCFHNYKIIVSQYQNFTERNVICECTKCKKRYADRRKHDYVYPLPTSLMLSDKDFNYILENGITANVLMGDVKDLEGNTQKVVLTVLTKPLTSN